MKALIQRVSSASVTVDDVIVGQIKTGILILLGCEQGDNATVIPWLVEKLCKLRIFPDEAGKMNRSIMDINGEFLVVSQFTLAGDCNKGTRPSFDKALAPDLAKELYETFITQLKNTSGLTVETGQFGAMMDVALVNDGPVTFMIEKAPHQNNC